MQGPGAISNLGLATPIVYRRTSQRDEKFVKRMESKSREFSSVVKWLDGRGLSMSMSISISISIDKRHSYGNVQSVVVRRE